MRMKGKTAVLVGGLSALGQAVVNAMLQEGVTRVVVLDRAEKAETATAWTKELPQQFWLLPVNTDDIQAMEDAAEQVVAKCSKIDALVNLQDEHSCGGLMEITEEEWTRIIGANLTQLYYSSHAFLPYMKKAGYGRVVNLTSAAGRCDDGSDIAYGATKTGVMGFTRGLAMEVREAGITANSVAVSDVKDEKICKAAVHAILYLASDEASWTTGDCMDVNNGTFMQN